MDNRSINLYLQGREDFELAMKLAMGTMTTSKVVGYRIDAKKMILYWSRNENMEPLPYCMNVEQAIEFVWGWLQSAEPAGEEPDHDGDNGKGFHMFNDAWGQVDTWEAFVAIEPIWAMYGK